MTTPDEQFATGGILPEGSGRYEFAEPDPPGYIIPRNWPPPKRSRAVMQIAARWCGLLSGPGDHFFRDEWWCNTCVVECTVDALCPCCTTNPTANSFSEVTL